MRPLRYSINLTLDGCTDHLAIAADQELHRFHTENLKRADAVLYGRITYQMMEEAWRKPASGVWPEWMDDWMIPFAETMDSTKKYVVSNTLDQVDWNSELVRGDLADAVRRLKEEPGRDNPHGPGSKRSAGSKIFSSLYQLLGWPTRRPRTVSVP